MSTCLSARSPSCAGTDRILEPLEVRSAFPSAASGCLGRPKRSIDLATRVAPPSHPSRCRCHRQHLLSASGHSRGRRCSSTLSGARPAVEPATPRPSASGARGRPSQGSRRPASRWNRTTPAMPPSSWPRCSATREPLSPPPLDSPRRRRRRGAPPARPPPPKFAIGPHRATNPAAGAAAPRHSRRRRGRGAPRECAPCNP
mmetsp:Transcript_36168/g.115974  ORF Transcript_36168/g.115974 Transcript_36168/m.115974 type:complete len:201 (+) Transcript_36168:926-1528(+)